MKKFFIILMLVIFISLLGCSPESRVADNLGWLADTPVLFFDDFSSQTGGWKTHEDRLTFSGYDQDGFRISVNQPNYLVWSVPGLNFQDINIYTKATKLSGPDNNLYGLICRYQDSNHFYAFVISSDGYYGIFRKQAGVLSMMGQTQMGFSEVIQGGGTANQMTAICRGDQLALVVNDVKLLQVQDETFSYGDVGLIAGNLETAGTDILFDYFIVVKP